jgi:hypothetical protein
MVASGMAWGCPDFTADDPLRVREAFRRYRTVLLRSVIAPALLRDLSERAERAYAEADDHPPTTGCDATLFHVGHIPPSRLGDERIDEAGAALAPICSKALGWPNQLQSPRDVLLRRILPPGQQRHGITPSVVWHQDEYFALASSPPGTPKPQLCFTAWVPLVDCGKDAPGLSVVLGSDEPIVFGTPRHGWLPYIYWRYGLRSIWRPEMNVGDVLLFTSRTIHGSNVKRGMTRARYSLEFRGGINVELSP